MLEPGSTLRRVWMALAAALVLYGAVSVGNDAEPLEPAHDAGLPRGLPRGPCGRAREPPREGGPEALSAAVAAEQQADPRRPLDPRQRRTARHRRAQPGAGRRGQGGAHAGEPSAPGERRRLSARQRGLLRGDRGRRRRPSRPDSASRLQTHLHEPSTTRSMPTAEIPRRWAWPALAAGLIGSLGLRLWGVGQGLPYAYNADEADHFLTRAVAMFEQHSLNPHYFANPPAFTYVLHFLLGARLRGCDRRGARVRAAPRRGVHARAGCRRRARHRCAVAAVRDGRAPVRPRRRPARGRDRGGRVPAGLLRAPRAQRCAHARAADAVAAGQRRRAAQRPPARLPAGGGRAGSRVREQVHRRDRARGARGGSRGTLPGGRAARRPAGAGRDRARGGGGAGLLPARQSLRRCSTIRASTSNWFTSPRCPPKRRASWARHAGAASSTTCGRSPGASDGCPRWRRSQARRRSGAQSARWAGCSCRVRCCSWRSWACRAVTSVAG